MNLKESIDREVEALVAQKASLCDQLNSEISDNIRRYGNVFHTCAYCLKKTQLKGSILIREYYAPAHEDYTSDTNTRFIVCPKCNAMTRYYTEKGLASIVHSHAAYLKVIDYNRDAYRPETVSIFGKEVYIENIIWKNSPKNA